MSDSNSSLGLQFTVNEVSGSVSVDSFLNITKRRESIVYRPALSAAAAAISFATCEDEVSATRNLSIIDKSTTIGINRVPNPQTVVKESASAFFVQTQDFMLTDTFVASESTVLDTPLYYRHVIDTEKLPREDASDKDWDLATDVSLLGVEVLDSNFTVLILSELSIDLDQGIVYNNLVPDFESASRFTYYYVKYSVRNGDNIYTYTDLLSNELVYKEVTFEDLDEFLQVKSGRKVYFINEDPNGYEVSLPAVKKYAFEHISDSKISVQPPALTTATDQWYVRIPNGKFFWAIDGIKYRYHLAQFLDQSFFPEVPYKFIDGEMSSILTSRLIKLAHRDVVVDDELHLSILVNDSTGAGIAAFTTDSSLAGTVASNLQLYKHWDTSSRIGIKSFDKATGFVDIEGVTLLSTYVLESTYYYEEKSYEFTLINLNPLLNRNIIPLKTVLFVEPDVLASPSTQTLYYLSVNETGLITDSDHPDFVTVSGWLVGSVWNDMYYDGKAEEVTPSGAWLTFTESLSVVGSGLYLVLGDMTIGEAQDIEDITWLDVRRRGGGIRQDLIDDAKLRQPEVSWYWDIGRWDGIPYPHNANFMVEVPASVLEDAGGRFQVDQVRDVIERHVAFGTYPVAKAYGIDIEVSGMDMVSSGLHISWTGYGF